MSNTNMSGDLPVSGWRRILAIHTQTSSSVLLLTLTALVVVQALPFTASLRRSADEVAFYDAWICGWQSVWTMSWDLARGQGRVGMLLSVPINAIGAAVAGSAAGRLLLVLLHFILLGVASIYVSRIALGRNAVLLFLILISLQPFSRPDEYMPPEAYPVQNTVPLLMMLMARLSGMAYPRHERLRRNTARVAFAIGLVANEFAFIAGALMMAGEHAKIIGDQSRPGGSIAAATWNHVREPAFRHDLATLLCALTVYGSFRAMYPSTYEGNVMNGVDEPIRVFLTMIRHIGAGVSMDALGTIWGAHFSASQLAEILGVGLATFFLALIFPPSVESVARPGWVLMGSFLAAGLITFPLAANARQQFICLERGACGYLDSRVSLVAIGAALLAILTFLIKRFKKRTRRLVIPSISLLIGGGAAATYAANGVRSAEAEIQAAAWRTAEQLSCAADLVALPDQLISRTIDPIDRVRFHYEEQRFSFWRRYMEYLSRSRNCNRADIEKSERVLQGVLPRLNSGETVYFSEQKSVRFLGRGWSRPEPWGVWSDSDRAELVVMADVPGSLGSTAILTFRPYRGPSMSALSITVLVNDRTIDHWLVPLDSDECCVRSIPLPRVSSITTTISLRIREPRRPHLEPDVKDGRRLGLGLLALSLVGPDSDQGPEAGVKPAGRGQ